MKYSYECSKCKSKEVYKPRKDLPKDPHTKCSQCGYENHFKDGDLEELKGEKAQTKKQKSIPPQNTTLTFIDEPNELLLSTAIRELNKPNPDPRWATILINCKKEKITNKTGAIDQFKQLPTKALISLLKKNLQGELS